MRAELRNANLKHRLDVRSRQFAQPQPLNFTSMKPWWELNAQRREQEAEQARQPKPVLQTIRRPVPKMPSDSLLIRAQRMFGNLMPGPGRAYA